MRTRFSHWMKKKSKGKKYTTVFDEPAIIIGIVAGWLFVIDNCIEKVYTFILYLNKNIKDDDVNYSRASRDEDDEKKKKKD